MKFPAPCIICGKELKSVGGTEEHYNQPYDATAFTSSGHYGSTVFDPMDGGVFLEVNICSDDLRAASKAGRVLIGRTEYRRPPQPTYELFAAYQPDEDS